MPKTSGLTTYRRLLRLYPKTYRDRYADQMVQTLGDMLEDQSTSVAKSRLWLGIWLDLPRSVAHQHLLAVGDGLAHDAPRSARRNGLFAGSLLLPFVAAILANNLVRGLSGQSLQNSWLWSQPAVIIWALALPTLAILITSLTIFGLLRRHNLRLKLVWPLVAIATLGIGFIAFLFFHDSVSCWTQHPTQSLTHLGQTWQCTQRGMLGGQ